MERYKMKEICIKKPGEIEKISKPEMEKRISIIQKCIDDPIYFTRNFYYIRSIDKGTIRIPLYKKQEELIKSIIDHRFTVCLAARQSGKTTAYIAVALYVCFFMSGKEIIIVANKEQTAIGILKRIKHAYEWIPEQDSWIKPGVKKWSEKQIEFENGCMVTAMASSSDSARSSSCYMMLWDEVAFVPLNISDNLFKSIWPTLSRSETSKCVMVSTANGVGGLFYDVWMDATVGGNKTWTPVLINWWDIEGRDEKWKQEQIKGFGPGGELKFAQEFGNEFLGSAPTLLDRTSLQELIDLNAECKIDEPSTWTVGSPKIGNFGITIYKDVQKGHAYILGGDVSEGIGLDYSVAKIFDITDVQHVEEVASFDSNTISGTLFGYVMAKMARKYNDAYVACERNGVSAVAIDALWKTFEYDNIVDIGSNKYAIGIFSNHSTKLDACLFFRDYLADPDNDLVLQDGQTILELQRFEKLKAKSMTTYAASTGHDDKVMSLIWAMYVLKPDILENYYTVLSYRKNRFGIETPARLYCDLANSTEGYFTSQEEFEALRNRLDSAADYKLKMLENSASNGEEILNPSEMENSDEEEISYDFTVTDSKLRTF